jgi:hypothetical protein
MRENPYSLELNYRFQDRHGLMQIKNAKGAKALIPKYPHPGLIFPNTTSYT